MAKQNDETAFNQKKGKRFPGKMPAQAEYPFRRWKQTADNVMIFEQNENGKVTRAMFHPSGTMEMIWPDGSKTTASSGEVIQEMEGSAITVRANYDVDVGGHMKTTVAGGARQEVAGSWDVVAKGATLNILGNAAIAVNGNAKISAKKSMDLNAEGTMSINSKGGMQIGADGGITVQAPTIDFQLEGDGAPGYKGS